MQTDGAAVPADFAQTLRTLRQAAGLSQEALAERAGVSARGVSDLERGLHRAPQRETVARLAQALGLSPTAQRQLHDLARRGRSERRAAVTREPAHDSAASGEATAAPLPSSALGGIPALPAPGAFLGALPAGALIGRDEQMQVMTHHVGLVMQGHGQMVLLCGAAGCGKTRLAQEVSATLLGQGFVAATGRCYEQEQTLPYAPLRSALAHLCAVAPSAVRDTLSRHWPALRRLLGDPTETMDGYGDSGNASAAQHHLFVAVARFLQELAALRPVALLVDDLHWADHATLLLLLFLARHARVARVFLLATYRSDSQGKGPLADRQDLSDVLLDLDREDLAVRCPIAPLDRLETAGMATALLDGVPLSTALADAVYRVTEGNPFFVRQMVRALLEQRAIAFQDGQWDSSTGGEIPVPDTVRAVIRQRCVRLDEGTRTMLSRASVLGHAFEIVDLQRMAAATDEEVEQALDAGATLGVVQPVSADAYAFDHVLTQQTLYSDLAPRLRQRWHRAAYAALEQRPERERRRRAGDLVRHAVQGGTVEQAIPYALLAGDEAEALWAHAEAEGHYRMALDLARSYGNARAEAESMEKVGAVLGMLSRQNEARDALERAAGLYRRLGDREGEGRVTAGIGSALADQGQVGSAIERLETMREVLADRPGRVSARLSYILSAVLYGAGRHDEAMAAAAQAGREALAVGDRHLWAAAECYRGDVLMQLCRPTEARAVLAAVAPVAEASRDLDSLTHSVHDLASAALLLGEMAEAEARIDQALALHRRRGVPAMVGAGLVLQGAIRFYRGNWGEGRASLEQGLEVLHEISSSWQTVVGLAWLSQMEAAAGRWAEATRWANEAIAQGEGTHLALPIAYQTLAEHALARGDVAAARRLLEPLTAGTSVFVGLMLPVLAEAHLAAGAVTEAEETILTLLCGMAVEVLLARADALRILGRVRGQQGRFAEAAQSFAEAIALARAMPYPYVAARALYAWGRLEQDHGDATSAHDHLREALAIAKDIGAAPYVSLLDGEVG